MSLKIVSLLLLSSSFALVHADPRGRNSEGGTQSQSAGQKTNESPLVFDNLSFGMTRADVLAKLKTSKFVELTVAETFLGRTGMNDVFRTRKKVGGLDASLFFDWSEDGKLKEITLQTPALPISALKGQLSPCWKEFASLLTTLYGKPVQADTELRVSTIQDSMLIPTHLWNLEKNGSAMLGVSRDGTKYMVVVRFSQKAAQRVALP